MMKKFAAFVLSASMLMALCACSQNQTTADETTGAVVEATEPVEEIEAPIVLVNGMTANELDSVSKRDFSLLDEPSEAEDTGNHSVQIAIEDYSIDELIENNEMLLEMGYLNQEEYEVTLATYTAIKEADSDYHEQYTVCILIDGTIYGGIWCPLDYDGGVMELGMTDSNGNYEEVAFANIDEYVECVYAKDLELYDEEYSRADADRARILADAIASGDYEIIESDSVDYSNPLLQFTPGSDNRNKWEYSADEVEALSDLISEYSIYDEELDTTFLAHVMLPPNYNPDGEYPVLLLTDGVWRFGDLPVLYNAMAEGEASDVILVSLGYDYYIDGTNEAVRYNNFVLNRDLLLDFITDNLMPYLGSEYAIDYRESTLFGHSDGGVFSHYALFNSDLYDNQPFGKYIIGSPAFWGVDDVDGPDGLLNDYGYFDRNNALDKDVFLCGGSEEDPDYEEAYEDGEMTTLEGLQALADRIGANGMTRGNNLVYRLYDSHHYQYVPAMLLEYLTDTYPA